jgi:hypothetical protein
LSGLVRWLRSSLRGEVSVAELTMRRAAGARAYALLEEAADLRGDDRGTRLFRVYAWNAFALQTIADKLLDADAEDDPATAGYVPRSTLLFVSACLDDVPAWIGRARVVQSDPEARAGPLPATVPGWEHDEPTRRSELHGLRLTYEALQPRVAGGLQQLRLDDPHASHEIYRLFAEMTTAFEYGCSLALPHAGPVDRGEARWRLLDALRHAFTLGQLLALPSLAEITAAQAPAAAAASWLQIKPGWLVVDRNGRRAGVVGRVRGDRDTGAFEGLELVAPLDAAVVCVPGHAIAAIGVGIVTLSVEAAALT